jgi:hypothetical protein
MKNYGAAVQGFCAGALMVLVVFAFMIGVAARSSPRAAANAAPQIGVTIHPTPSPQAVAAAPFSDASTMVNPQATRPMATAAPTEVDATPTPSSTVTMVDARTGKAIRPCTAVLTDTLATPGAGRSCLGEESEEAASGGYVCAIRRDSCAFSFLVGNLDPGIAFLSDDPAPRSDEDRLMHPALLLPLNKLRKMVERQWNGESSLMVADAYDSSGAPAGSDIAQDTRRGLLYEGRAVELQVYPDDVGKLGSLCKLALEAGFDYVQNTGKRCYASIEAKSLCDICASPGAYPPKSAPPSPVLVPLVTAMPTQTVTPSPAEPPQQPPVPPPAASPSPEPHP